MPEYWRVVDDPFTFIEFLSEEYGLGVVTHEVIFTFQILHVFDRLGE